MTRRQKAIGFFITLCVLLVGAAILLNIYWIVITEKQIVELLVGILLFALIIAGIIVYTVFLVMEIQRNEEHDTFINAVDPGWKGALPATFIYARDGRLVSRIEGPTNKQRLTDTVTPLLESKGP